jgi:hypothetical protein
MTNTAPAASLVVSALLWTGKTALIASTTENTKCDIFDIEKLLDSTNFASTNVGNATHQVAILRKFGQRSDQSFSFKKKFKPAQAPPSPLVDFWYRRAIKAATQSPQQLSGPIGDFFLADLDGVAALEKGMSSTYGIPQKHPKRHSYRSKMHL